MVQFLFSKFIHPKACRTLDLDHWAMPKIQRFSKLPRRGCCLLCSTLLQLAHNSLGRSRSHCRYAVRTIASVRADSRNPVIFKKDAVAVLQPKLGQEIVRMKKRICLFALSECLRLPVNIQYTICFPCVCLTLKPNYLRSISIFISLHLHALQNLTNSHFKNQIHRHRPHH